MNKKEEKRKRTKKDIFSNSSITKTNIFNK
jgi:hypothetical protein